MNHIGEGGRRSAHKLAHVAAAAAGANHNYHAVQLRCNCCDWYTNSIQKLSVHAQLRRHDNMQLVYQHVLRLSAELTQVSPF